MGCGSSSAADNGEKFGADAEFEGDSRKILDKKTGVGNGRPVEKPEEDFFETVAAEGESFMAVCPWKGQIEEPENHNAINPAKPDCQYEIHHVYGYKCQDARQNCYYNATGNVCYPTAALGIVLDQTSNTQKFFGGEESTNEHRNQKNNMTSHNDDITGLAMSNDRSFCVTGQRGPAPTLFSWDSKSAQMKQRFQLSRGARGISSVTISADNKYMACVDMSNNHNVIVFDIESGAKQYEEKGDTNYIYDCAFSKKEGDYSLMTSGNKHLYFWDFKTHQKKRGIAGSHGIVSHQVCCWDAEGVAYSGGADGRIFVWKERACVEAKEAHKGYIGAINTVGGKLFTGGKDHKVCEWNLSDLSALRTFDFTDRPLSIDCMGENILVSLRNGDILEMVGGTEQKAIMQSHDKGEVWGLADCGLSHIVTSGDDNKVLVWDIDNRKLALSMTVSDEKRNSRKGKASTVSNLPASQCARAITCTGNNSVVCANDGRVHVNEGSSKIKVLEEPDEWCQAAAFNKSGTMLAVGSHDNNVYVYKKEDWSFVGKCVGHHSYITALDWSEDGKWIRTNSGDYELLFWDAETCEQNTNGRSDLKDVIWATTTCPLTWETEGCFPKGVDGTHVNKVGRDDTGNYLVTGDDWCMMNIFNNPARPGNRPRSYKGHSEFVTNVIFKDGRYIISTGGYDNTIIQWIKK